MKKESIEPLQKNTIIKGSGEAAIEPSACCGGNPVNNEDACCKLDEDKKAEGEEGCGCGTSATKTPAASCC